MSQHQQISFIPWRFYLLLSVIIFAVAGLLWRILDLVILDQLFLRHEGNERVLRLINMPAFRGMITDRNGFPLAVSTKVYSIWVNPKGFNPSKEQLLALAHLLAMKPSDVLKLSAQQVQKQREFAYLKRSLPPEVAEKIKALKIPGLFAQEAYRRFYPEGEVTAHVLGITNVDDQGQEGIELAYNQWLAGESGKQLVIRDRLGRIIADVQTVKQQKPGKDIVLSIDRRIQYLVYRELMKGVLDNKAQAGSAVVLDVITGEVLAMVNYPSFNPNQRPLRVEEKGNVRNRAVTDLFEPGSTIKPFSIASALDSGLFKANSVIDTSPGWIKVGNNIVRDQRNNGLLTMTKILQVSSNIGITKMVLSSPAGQLWKILHSVGFGEMTGVGFPGEQSGMLIQQNMHGPFMLATISWGYGLSVTAMQLASAYAVLANAGVKIPVTLLRINQVPEGRRILDAKIASDILVMLESVVSKGGTGQLAFVPGYRIAGKTGTAKISSNGGYEQHRYKSSFVGIAPVSHPRLVVMVVIHDPQGKEYGGGAVAGPVFERIMEGTLRLLDIPPDAPETPRNVASF